MHFKRFSFVFLTLLLFVISSVNCINKYSAKANEARVDDESESNFRALEKPFRMAKLNLLWTKAQTRLTEPKLKSLFSELKIHDKEEIAWKKIKSEAIDKDGLKEADLRKKLIGIMSTYGLLEHFDDTQDPEKYKHHKAFSGPVPKTDAYLNKSVFKDKKLNKLWYQAEHAGFTNEELQALREEFSHHQDKIDQYYSILSEVEKGKTDQHENAIYEDATLEHFNTIEFEEQIDADKVPKKDYIHHSNLLKEKHRDLRDGYDRLHRLAAKGPKSKEFVEPKVQGLWQLALEGKFSQEELHSLKVELLHYESRLLKLRHLQAEHVLNADKHTKKIAANSGDKTDGMLVMEETIKKQARKVEKLHGDIENRILRKHSEL